MISHIPEFELYLLRLEENINTLKSYVLVKEKRSVIVAGIEKSCSNLLKIKKTMYSHLIAWQYIEISRNFSRTLPREYIDTLFTDFQELSGDRICSNDKAIVGGLAKLSKNTVMVIAQQKGKSIKQRSEALFGMTSPAGFRKSIRLMKIAERFNIPIVTFVDSPGADPGILAEKNNQSSAIANSLLKMPSLSVPIISIITGEGCSGGALAVSIGDVVLMLQYSYYSVLSPEGCALILQGKKDNKEYFADNLSLTAEYLYNHGLVHDIVPEFNEKNKSNFTVQKLLKDKIVKYLFSLLKVSKKTLVDRRLMHWKFN